VFFLHLHKCGGTLVCNHFNFMGRRLGAMSMEKKAGPGEVPCEFIAVHSMSSLWSS
jgi:hypothetical protein